MVDVAVAEGVIGVAVALVCVRDLLLLIVSLFSSLLCIPCTIAHTLQHRLLTVCHGVPWYTTRLHITSEILVLHQ